MAKARTAAVYSRFSSDLQKDRSISDQEALCGFFIERDGLSIVRRFADRAKSGSSMLGRYRQRRLILVIAAIEQNLPIVA